MFRIIKKDEHTRARTGVIQTAHGEIETPSYVMVATHGMVKTLTVPEVHSTKTQLLISNAFHLWQNIIPKLQKAGGIHELFGWTGKDKSMPMMTDSGGFQVFSYGFAREHGLGKVGMFADEHKRRAIKYRTYKEKNLVTITGDGVRFYNPKAFGPVKYLMLTPARSMEIQRVIGADIVFAFDECTSPEHSYEYTKASLQRTHAWAKICSAAPRRPYQKLYGIVQGGHWRDLREESAKFINSLGFDGYGIGGSFGKTEMREVLDWTMPFLDEVKPRHLLGIGEIRDVLDGISRGIDTFDCVIPTREARHGSIWTPDGRYDVRSVSQRRDLPLQEGCECGACSIVTRKRLREMFKTKDYNAGRLATIHNMYFFNTLMAEARAAISSGTFQEYRESAIQRLSKKP